MRKVTVAAIQMSCSWDFAANLDKAERLVREAHARGARIILLPELFETPYFCQVETMDHYQYATELERNRAVARFQKIAAALEVVLPISFFEQKNTVRYNSVAVIDADGTVLGIYRKTHIPDGPGYEEKFYFTPGDTGFQVWPTRYGRIGVAICWDQWFPETARAMALLGAEVLLYPTAIGSEPSEPEVDSKEHWQLCMQGHAAANIMPVMAANRVGTEVAGDSQITFFGSSFITNQTGVKIAAADHFSENVIIAEFDLDETEKHRDSWGVFRDRRPEMYRVLLTSDGVVRAEK